jgi:phosphoenolpyruvate phosphomutase
MPNDRLLGNWRQTGVGVHNGLSARIAARHGFDFLWLSSFEASAAAGLPDVGLLDADEMLALARAIRRLVDVPLVVDMDTGYGDAAKTYHAVRAFARAGVAGVAVEDNPVAKRCSLYDGYRRELASAAEHAARVRAARLAADAERSSCLVVARTEALVAGLGVDEALARLETYVAAGADGVFVQSLDTTGEEVLELCLQWEQRTPVFLAPTRFAHVPKETLFTTGASHVIFANYGLRAAHRALDETFARLASAPCAAVVDADVSAVRDVSSEVGEDEFARLEREIHAVPREGLAATSQPT